MNILKWAVDWLEKDRATHMIEDVEIGYPNQVFHALPATVSHQTTILDQNGVKIQTNWYHFIFVTKSLEETGLELTRGLQIKRLDHPDVIYELAVHGKLMFEYNDPFKKSIILHCTEKAC